MIRSELNARVNFPARAPSASTKNASSIMGTRILLTTNPAEFFTEIRILLSRASTVTSDWCPEHCRGSIRSIRSIRMRLYYIARVDDNRLTRSQSARIATSIAPACSDASVPFEQFDKTPDCRLRFATSNGDPKLPLLLAGGNDP